MRAPRGRRQLVDVYDLGVVAPEGNRDAVAKPNDAIGVAPANRDLAWFHLSL
jgi:hypothetical protein